MPTVRDKAEESLRSIIDAAALLDRTANAGSVTREAAFGQVLDASSTANLAHRYFSAPSDKTESVELDWNSATAAASLELRSAQVLVGVALARGEGLAPSSIKADEFLRTAITDAQTEIDRLKGDEGEKRFAATSDALPPSADLDSALEEFRRITDTTVSRIVSDSERVVSVAIDAITKHGGDLLKTIQGIAEIPTWVADLEGFLLRAWEKIQSAFQFLREMVTSVPIQAVTDKVKELQAKATVRGGLEWVYDVTATRGTLASLVLRRGAVIAEVDKARNDISTLGTRFSAVSKTLQSISLTITVTGVVAAHFAGPSGLLFVPVGNGLITAVTLLAGMDFMGSLELLKDVQGVRRIVVNLAEPQQIGQ